MDKGDSKRRNITAQRRLYSKKASRRKEQKSERDQTEKLAINLLIE